MPNKVLTINSAESLYKPLEILVDGQIFRVKRVTLDGMALIQEKYEDAKLGSAAAIKQMLGETLEGPLELLGKLPVDKIREIIEFAVKEAVQPEGDSKKAPGRGPQQ